MKVMNITLLPLEIIHLLMENLKSERSSLHALTLTSKALRWEATRFLYLSMTDTSGTTHYKFLSTIRKHPVELAPLVQIYHAPTDAHEQRGHLWGITRRCLPLMVNLKELAFHKIIGNPLQIFPTVGKGQKMPFHLDRFVWMVQDPNHEKDMQKFLESQSELTHVQWPTSHSVVLQFPENACRKLTSFVGSTSTIRTILPSRSITELCWLNEWASYRWSQSRFRHDPIEVFELKEFAALHGLSLGASVWDSVVSHPRFKGSSSLEVLEVPAVMDYNSGRLDKFDWMNLHAILHKFSRLKKLVITPSSPFTEIVDMQDDPTSEIGQVFAQCLHVRYVDILWDNDRIYRRWVMESPCLTCCRLSAIGY